MADQTPTFGMTIRAARLGFRAVFGVGYVRIDGSTPKTYHRIDVAPFAAMRAGGKLGGMLHIVWWTDRESVKLVEAVVRRYFRKPVARPQTIYVDDNGDLLAQPI